MALSAAGHRGLKFSRVNCGRSEEDDCIAVIGAQTGRGRTVEEEGEKMAQKKAGVVNNTRREGFQSFPQGEQNNSVARHTAPAPHP